MLVVIRFFILVMSVVLPALIVFSIVYSNSLIVSGMFVAFLVAVVYQMRREHEEVFSYLMSVLFYRLPVPLGEAVVIRIGPSGKGYRAYFTAEFTAWRNETCERKLGIVRNELRLDNGSNTVMLWFVSNNDRLHCKLRWC